jgi:nuclear pore complex protein Nup93
VVLITLQFEKAIEFLWGKGDYAVEAVHFATGLYYYGVLRVPDADAPRSPNSIYSETSGTEPSLTPAHRFSFDLSADPPV